MKRAVTLVVGTGMMIAAAALAAMADDTVTAKVPFAFVVSGVQLPAGDYVVTRDGRNPDLVSIARASGDGATLVMTRRAANESTEQDAKLDFVRVGKEMHLSQVTLGPGNAREVPVTAVEEDAARR